MAKSKKRVAARKRSAKRGKASVKPAPKKLKRRTASAKTKSKVRRVTASKGKKPRKIAAKREARKTPKAIAQAPVETTIIDVVEEPVPGVVVVTEYEAVRTIAPDTRLGGGSSES